MLSNILDRISFWSLFLVIVLLPVFFLPFSRIPVETSKGLFLVIGLVISIIFWAAARFSDGKIVLPKSYLLLSGFGIVLTVLISAIFSSAPSLSFFGVMFDIGSFWFIFSAVLLMLMSAILLKEKENAKKVLFGIIISSSVVFLFQILHIFMPNTLALGVLNGKTSNLIGTWNSFALLVGFSGITALFLIEFFSLSKLIKLALRIFVGLAIIMAMVVNFALVWKLLGIFALVIFVYKISFASHQDGEEHRTHFPATSFVVVIISLLFFMSGQFIGGYLPDRLGISDLEISPSLSSTMQVTGKALKEDPILGIGPNRFDQVWAMYKPKMINNTVFWNTSFTSGFGLLPTFAATTGSLGILSWILFLSLLILLGIKTISRSIKRSENYETVLFFILAFYLLLSSFFYSSGSVVFLFIMAFAGIFIGVSSHNKENGEITISFLDDPRKSFFSILALVLLMITSAALSFKYVERFASISSFGKAVSAENVPDAETAIGRAVSLYPNDLYLRTYSQVYLTKLGSDVSKKDSLSEAEKAQLQVDFDEAVNGSILATKYNKENYLNFQSLGSVYNTVASLGLSKAYDQAIEAYKQASKLNPLNPGLKLSIANIYLTQDKIEDARKVALEALDLKPNYIDLLITLSQIEKKDGNKDLSVNYAERALRLSPSNENLIKYVDSLKTSNNSSVSVSDNNEKENTKE